jgi:hypothetical protein
MIPVTFTNEIARAIIADRRAQAQLDFLARAVAESRTSRRFNWARRRPAASSAGTAGGPQRIATGQSRSTSGELLPVYERI